MGIKDYSVLEANNLALGQGDFLTISSATVLPPTGFIFYALVSDTNATYSADTKDGDNLTSQLRNAGTVRFGRFTSVNETSGGIVLGYYAKDIGK